MGLLGKGVARRLLVISLSNSDIYLYTYYAFDGTFTSIMYSRHGNVMRKECPRMHALEHRHYFFL